jgi:hypothetical protein
MKMKALGALASAVLISQFISCSLTERLQQAHEKIAVVKQEVTLERFSKGTRQCKTPCSSHANCKSHAGGRTIRK